MRAMGTTMGLLIFMGGGYMACCAPFLIAADAEEAAMLTASGVVPFLLAFPAIVCAEGWPRGNEAALLPAAFGLGTIGYWVAGCILWQVAVERFDDWSGRLAGWRYWDGQRYWDGPPPDTAALLAAERVGVPAAVHDEAGAVTHASSISADRDPPALRPAS